MRFHLFHWSAQLTLLIALACLAGGETAPFDLTGPRLQVKVTRAGKTLPIAEVPHLAPGDRLWIHPAFPANESVRYLLVAAFLRGSTNPPPENWFFKAETWTKPVKDEGVVITVPQDAQQALLFLAPQTGGGFTTLRSAVRGKPGAFVRAAQDLNQASLDRSRLERYLGAVRRISENDPDTLRDRSVLLARSLNIKLDQACFDRPVEQQLSCLTQNSDQLVLDDGHSQSMVAALTSGPNSDLIGQISSTKLAGGGAYSAYVGAIVDVARIMGNLHTASYQYIPALSVPKQDQLNVKLNNPPSFHKPMSVLVIGLPLVEAAQLPPLRAVDAHQLFCLQKPALVLPVEGAPLVFATELAHDFVLHMQSQSGEGIDLPAVADAARGGFVVDTRALRTAHVAPESKGTLRGYWGFQPFEGPDFPLRSAHATNWAVTAPEKNNLVVGREGVLHLRADAAVCVEQVSVRDQQGKMTQASWKLSKPDELEVRVPLQGAAPGPVKLVLRQYGSAKPDDVSIQTFSEPGHIDRLVIHAGDQQGLLKGTRLDEVAKVEVSGVEFVPTGLARVDNQDELRLSSPDAASAVSLKGEEKVVAHVALKDGRVMDLQTTVENPRPKVTLVSKSIQRAQTASPSPIRLATQDDLPQDGRLSFFMKSDVPATFPHDEKIEVATEDGSFHALLTVADGNLVRQDSQTVLGVLDPLKSFGPSAFGPLRFRPVSATGVEGEWQSLAKLVRVPNLKEIRCPDSPDRQCILSGTNLFLLDSVASEPQFSRAVSIPPGFANTNVNVPRPNGTLLYVKLRDDPSTVNVAILPVFPE